MLLRAHLKVFAASGKATRLPAGEKDKLRNKKVKAKAAANKKSLTVRLNPAAIKQFKALAVELEKTQEAAMAEALNLLFKNMGNRRSRSCPSQRVLTEHPQS